MTESGNRAVPVAKQVPFERKHHGDTFVDPYEWMRDKQSPEVQEYVAAQNRLCENRNKPLASCATHCSTS